MKFECRKVGSVRSVVPESCCVYKDECEKARRSKVKIEWNGGWQVGLEDCGCSGKSVPGTGVEKINRNVGDNLDSGYGRSKLVQ